MAIVTGDTKVVERGACDGLYITTTGVGEVVVDHELGPQAVREGDDVLLSGTIGDHALAVLAARGEFHFSVDLESDCAPLWGLVEAAIEAGRGAALRARPDARWADDRARRARRRGALGVEIEEEASTRLAGRCARSATCSATSRSRSPTKARCSSSSRRRRPTPSWRRCAPIRGWPRRGAAGVVTAAHPGRVALRTVYGTRRVLDMPVGELLPRIC